MQCIAGRGSSQLNLEKVTAMADDNKNEKPDLDLPELPEELRDIPELQDLQNAGKTPGEPKKPDPEEERKERNKLLVGSQFAYTLVISALLFGYLGHWLGTLLGGGLWSMTFMLLLGGLGFGVEMWRMIRFFDPKSKKPKNKDDDDTASK